MNIGRNASLARRMTLIDGKAIAQQVRAEIREEIAASDRDPPGLATILVGDDAASAIYVGGKQKASAEVGIRGFDHRLPHDASHDQVRALLHELNANPAVNGILLQLPTPPQVDGPALTHGDRPRQGRRRADADLAPACWSKGCRACARAPRAAAWSCCAAMTCRSRAPRRSSSARSDLVGKPISAMLLAANATVTTCHSRTRDLADVCRRADVLVAAVGVPEMIKGDWVKPGAVVIDVGMNRTPEKLVGDVEFESAAERASLITPVPGGVGPMTIAMLLRNTLEAAKAAA